MSDEQRAYRDAARSYAIAGIHKLAELAGIKPDPKDPSGQTLLPGAVSEQVRVAAISLLHDRGWGKARQEIELNIGESTLQRIAGEVTPEQASITYSSNLLGSIIDANYEVVVPSDEDEANQEEDQTP